MQCVVRPHTNRKLRLRHRACDSTGTAQQLMHIMAECLMTHVGARAPAEGESREGADHHQPLREWKVPVVVSGCRAEGEAVGAAKAR